MAEKVKTVIGFYFLSPDFLNFADTQTADKDQLKPSVVKIFRIYILSRTRKSGLLEKSLDDSQHIFPIDLLEGNHKNPPVKSKNRHSKDNYEDSQHLKFFPKREKAEEKKEPENKDHKKSQNKNLDVPVTVPETLDQKYDSDSSENDDQKRKIKSQDWKSDLVLGESDIIKKLYSSVPEGKVYEVCS